MVADWDPYHADKAAAFFDPDWMFSLDFRLQRSSGTWRGNLNLINEAGGQMDLVSSRSITGFDIVIGNPPYVRQEELKKMKAFEGLPGLERPLKDALKDDYFCYTGVADLYVSFYERAFDLLAPGGGLYRTRSGVATCGLFSTICNRFQFLVLPDESNKQ